MTAVAAEDLVVEMPEPLRERLEVVGARREGSVSDPEPGGHTQRERAEREPVLREPAPIAEHADEPGEGDHQHHAVGVREHDGGDGGGGEPLRAPAPARRRELRAREQREPEHAIELEGAPEDRAVVDERQREQAEPCGLAQRAQQREHAERVAEQRKERDAAHRRLEGQQLREAERERVGEQVERVRPRRHVMRREPELRIVEGEQDPDGGPVLGEVRHREPAEDQRRRGEQGAERQHQPPRARVRRSHRASQSCHGGASKTSS